MRIGLAGAGRIGAFHAATLASLDGVDEVVVGDSRPAVAHAVAASLPAARAVDVTALVGSGIDALVIATSTPGHAPLLRAAVAAGLPTFCEKPVAATLDETIEVARLVEASGVQVHIGFQRRFDTGYRARGPPWRPGRCPRPRPHPARHHQRPPPAGSGLRAYLRRASSATAPCTTSTRCDS